MSENVFVVEITPVIDTAGNTQTFLFGTSAFATGPTDTPANTSVRPYLKNPGSLRRELFSGARITGAINPSYGNIVLANVAPTEDAAGDLDDWLSYGLSGSKVVVRYGTIGDAYPDNWTTVYIAYAQSFVADLNEITIRLRDRLQLFDRPIVSSGFNGSGGLEGTVSATKKKQFVAGICEFIPAVLIDEQRQIYFVQSTAPHIYDLTTRFLVYDNGIPIAKQSNYTSSSTLLDVAPGEGFCRFYFGNHSGYYILNAQFIAGRGLVFPQEVLGTTRRWPDRNGPVYFRLGSPPAGDIRVSTYGAPDDTDYARGGANVQIGVFSAATFATRVDVPIADIDASAQTLFIQGRFVADNLTYLDVLADQCLASQGWFGFTRLDKFRAGTLQDPLDGTSTSLYEFTLANIQQLRREPINGMEAPVWKLSVSAGQTYPSQVANGASSTVKDYLTREVWNSFQGVSTDALKQNPGAIATTLEIKGRDFQSQEQIKAFLERYFILFGGRRDFFTLTTPMSAEVLALELHDVVTLKIPRFGLSAGKKFRIVGIEIQCASSKGPTVKLTLWGGEKGVLTGYDGGPDARPTEEQTLIDPLIFQEQMGDFESEFFAITDLPSDSFSLMDDFTSVFLCEITDGGCDSSFDSVVLSLHFDGADMSTTFTDSSSYNRAVTRVGSAVIETDQSKFGGASGKFNDPGTGDYLRYTQSGDFNLTGDFTVEAWIYLTIIPDNNGQSKAVGTIAAYRNNVNDGTTTNKGWHFSVNKTDNKLIFGSPSTPQNSNFVDCSYTFSLNTWYHIAVTNNAGTIKLFVDGVSQTLTTNNLTVNSVTASGNELQIARLGFSYQQYFRGYIDDLRITKGVARYTADFTIPSAAYPNGPCFGFDRTMLQLHFDGLNNTTTFTDSSSYNRTATVVNQAKISTAQSKFGGSSGYFDGTGDRITFPASNDFWVGNQDFTIEFWVYFNRVNASQGLVVLRNSSFTSGVCYYIGGSNNGILTATFASGGTAYSYSSATNTVTTGQWYHVAIVRNNTNMYIFRDGISVATRTVTSGLSFNLINNTLAIGSDPNGFGDLDGYIDELRIIKGFAIYTSDFTPPTAPFPDE